MPELPEVETICRQLKNEIVGKKITAVDVLTVKSLKTTKATFLKAVIGQKVLAVDRRAKLIIWHLNNGYSILTHLKMTGQYVFNGLIGKHTRVVFHFSKLQVMFNDMRRFGYLKIIKTADLATLLNQEYGPEPLEKDFTLVKFIFVLGRRPNMKIKQLLLEQKLIAGIGNIYAQEACYMSGILPTRQAKNLQPEEVKKLYHNIRLVMNNAIKYGGTSTENYLNLYGKKGDFTKKLKVYGRGGEQCGQCGQMLKNIKLGGRGTVYCEKCQR